MKLTKTSGASLSQILAYHNAKVVERYEEELKLTHAEALQLFEDVKLFLFIAATAKTDKMVCPPRMIDLGWHEFIMFTEDYMNFCNAAFGQYMHHRPFTKADKADSKRPIFKIASHAKGLLAGIDLTISTNWKMVVKDAICGYGDCLPGFECLFEDTPRALDGRITTPIFQGKGDPCAETHLV